MNRWQLYQQENFSHDFLCKYPLSDLSQVAKLDKIVLHMTSSNVLSDPKQMIPGLLACELLSGQKLRTQQAKMSVASFQLREGQLIGWKVTLRGIPMYTLLEKWLLFWASQDRQWSGVLSSQIDSKGHLHIGITDLLRFVELEPHFELFGALHGCQLSLIPTTNTSPQEARILYSALQIPTHS
jgi:large subunit ribosomal protein L5